MRESGKSMQISKDGGDTFHKSKSTFCSFCCQINLRGQQEENNCYNSQSKNMRF